MAAGKKRGLDMQPVICLHLEVAETVPIQGLGPSLCVSSVGYSSPLLQRLSWLVQLLQSWLLTLTPRTTDTPLSRAAWKLSTVDMVWVAMKCSLGTADLRQCYRLFPPHCCVTRRVFTHRRLNTTAFGL